MTVTLQPLTLENWRECSELRVAGEQEEFVAPNLFSIAQSRFEPTWVPLAIYDDTTMVGFLMYDTADYELVRLMIDHRYQGRGYGRAALRLLLDQFEQKLAFPTASTSYVPGNTVAERLYLSLGYVMTGEVNDGEIVVRKELRGQR